MDLIHEACPGYNPVVEMSKIACDESIDLSIRMTAHKEVSKYVAPQLKAVEVSSQDGGIHLTWDTGIDRNNPPKE